MTRESKDKIIQFINNYFEPYCKVPNVCTTFKKNNFMITVYYDGQIIFEVEDPETTCQFIPVVEIKNREHIRKLFYYTQNDKL